MLNFSIGPGSNHLQELRQYVRCNSCTDSAVLSILFQEINLPIDEYMKNIVGIPFEYGNEGVAEYAAFGMFHSIPNIHSLDIGTLDSISRTAVAKTTTVTCPSVVRTDINDGSVAIYYDVEERHIPAGYNSPCQQLQVRPSMRYWSGVYYCDMDAAITELTGARQLPIARFGDMNCYSVSIEEMSAVFNKHIEVSGLSLDYVLLRDILQRLYPTYEEFLDERSFIVNAGKICNELAASYPEEAWKEAVNMERVIYYIDFLQERYGKDVQSTGNGEQDHNKFLAAVYRDTRTKQELDDSELEMMVRNTLGQFGYTDDQKLFTIVVKNQPTTD